MIGVALNVIIHSKHAALAERSKLLLQPAVCLSWLRVQGIGVLKKAVYCWAMAAFD